jgi:NAD(P)-dependent dehydrogenase (short-subunit alcohol dehydrogenase family)
MDTVLAPIGLTDQRVVVVGGSSGIGLGIARACLAAGAEVTIVGRDEVRLNAALAHLARPDRARAAAADVRAETQVEQLFHNTGEVDHVVVTAATPLYGAVRELDMAAATAAFDAKVLAALRVSKHAAISSHGSLVLTAGVASDRPAPGGAVVAGANGAIVALVRALAMELAPIRVNAVAPGWIDTPLWDTIAGDAKDERMGEQAARLPVGRVGTPADIAAAVVFLLGSTFTTGETLHVDGGHRLV